MNFPSSLGVLLYKPRPDIDTLLCSIGLECVKKLRLGTICIIVLYCIMLKNYVGYLRAQFIGTSLGVWGRPVGHSMICVKLRAVEW